MLTRRELAEQGVCHEPGEYKATAERLDRWLYYTTRECSTCPHGMGMAGSMCDVPKATERPCWTSEWAAVAWLEGEGRGDGTTP